MKRFESKDRDAPAGTRSGPRARAAQDRKFGAARSGPRDPTRDSTRDSTKNDPYQRAARAARSGPPRDAPYAERLRAPARSGGIELDPDVARVFRDSEAVNEALRMVIRLARLAGGSPRPAFSSDRARSGPSSGPRSRPPAGPPARSRDERPRGPRAAAPPARREPKFEKPE